MKIAYKLLPIVLALFLTISFNCNTTEPPPPTNGTLYISLIDVSCTEAWVELKTNGVTFPVNVNISADGNTVAQLTNLSKPDTTVYIDSLLPNKAYNIQAIIQSTNQYQATSSNKLAVQTLDTTSNNFTWQTFTFGASNAGSSTLNDVAIIDANNIWAVGSINLDDSTGNPDPEPYALAHWDGMNWKLQKIYYHTSTGFKMIISNISGILYLNSGDIWFAAGSIFHWDGKSDTSQLVYSRLDLADPNATIEKLWGDGSQIYGVGNAGTMVLYNSNSWQKIESGTTTDIDDIWGVKDSLVLATVSNRYSYGEYKLLSITPTSVSEYMSWPYQRLYGIWFNSSREIYVVSNSAYLYKNNTWATINLPTNYFLTRIRGNALNDIYIVGTSGIIFHFNGVGWQNLNQIGADYEGLDTKVNTVVAVGFNTSGSIIADAVITIGKR